MTLAADTFSGLIDDLNIVNSVISEYQVKKIAGKGLQLFDNEWYDEMMNAIHSSV